LNSDEAIRVVRTELERDAYKQALEAYQKSLETLKWAIGIIGTLVLTLIAYALFKDKKEYDNALKSAEKACEKAEQWEEKARNTCDKIDTLVKARLDEIEAKSKEQARRSDEKINTLVEAKLKEIEERTKKSTEQIDAKAQEQMRIAELLNEAMRLYNEGKYEEACDKYTQIVKLKPDSYLAYNNWGVALAELAKSKEDEKLFEEARHKYEEAIKINPDMYQAYRNLASALANRAELKKDEKLFEQACCEFEQAIKGNPDIYDAYIDYGVTLAFWATVKGNEDLFKEACRKYEQAIKIKPDDPLAYSCWGGTFLRWARFKTGTEEHQGMLKGAEEKCLKAENLKKGSGAYVFARMCAVRDDKEGCRKWLELAQETNNLPIRRHAMNDPDVASVRDEDWFKKLKWKGEK
jgi:tetratricopeptide (TPR) repeat protein